MPLTLSIVDETTADERCSAGAFQFDATLTLRELIRVRIQREAKRFNDNESEVFRGLVQPEESERILNGVRQRPMLDWENQSPEPSPPSRATDLSSCWTNGRSPIWMRRCISHLKANSPS